MTPGPYREAAGAPDPQLDLSRAWWQRVLIWLAFDDLEAQAWFRRLCGGRWWFGPYLLYGPPIPRAVPLVLDSMWTPMQRDPEVLQGLTPEDLQARRGSVLWIIAVSTARWQAGPQCPHVWRYTVGPGMETAERLPAVPCTCEVYPRKPGFWSSARVHNAAFVLILLALLLQGWRRC